MNGDHSASEIQERIERQGIIHVRQPPYMYIGPVCLGVLIACKLAFGHPGSGSRGGPLPTEILYVVLVLFALLFAVYTQTDFIFSRECVTVFMLFGLLTRRLEYKDIQSVLKLTDRSGVRPKLVIKFARGGKISLFWPAKNVVLIGDILDPLSKWPPLL